jgi:formamidopyrimidine-DNA glycosylase
VRDLIDPRHGAATRMPELPDIVVYLECLRSRVLGAQLERIRIASPFVLRSVDPPVADFAGRTTVALRRIGKRIVLGVEGDLFLIIHLMIAGRLRWRDPDAPIPRKLGLAALDFRSGTLLFTEAGSTKRASLYAVRGEPSLTRHDPGGLEPLDASIEAFGGALRRENHTLKRALTDPHVFSGIGNAYSDEILHAARLSPLKLTSTLTDDEIARLHAQTQATLHRWIERLRQEAGPGFPEKVTAFHGEMAVHGKYRQACPVCGSPVQRIVYAQNESNYCAPCQTGGRLLADRSLSRLLREDWPKNLDEWEKTGSGE